MKSKAGYDRPPPPPPPPHMLFDALQILARLMYYVIKSLLLYLVLGLRILSDRLKVGLAV